MKRSLIVFTIATAVVSADLVNPPEHEHRIGFAPSLDQWGASTGYEHIKPDSIYFSAATILNKNVSVSVAGVGYNFSLSDKDKLTPSVGLGILKAKHFSGVDLFPVINLEYSHRINDRFSIGAIGGSFLKRDFNIHIGVPFTVYLGEERNWEARLIPIFTHNEGIYASRNKISLGYSLGYRF